MRRLAPPAALAIGLLLAACGPSPERLERDRRDIEAMLEEYLPALGEGYVSGNLEPLREWAAEKEIATIFKRVQDLRDQGRRLEPAFRDVEVEDLNIPSYSNAYVTTVETWDLTMYAAGTETVLSESRGQRSRVQYQLLRRDDGSWQVLSRQVAEVLD